jgi:hypothetical protein
MVDKKMKKTTKKTTKRKTKRTNGFEKNIGSRAEVWHGTAKKTSGGLIKEDLIMNKRGRIVSKKMSERATKEKRLVKAGYNPKKGTFKLFTKKNGIKSKKSKK